jgi:hypothetical protein
VKTAAKPTDEEIIQRGLEVLLRELGLVGYIRFMRHFAKGSGDYSVERHAWLDKLSLDEILRSLDAPDPNP